MNEYATQAEAALRARRRVILSRGGSAAAQVGLDTARARGDGAWVLEVFDGAGALEHRCEVDAETARRLVMAGAIEIG